MHQVHLHAEFLVQVLGKMLCRIYGTVLTACTAETYGQAGETAFHIPFYGCIHQGVYVLEEDGDFSVLFKKADNGFVEAGEGLVTSYLPGLFTARQSNTKPPPLPEESSGMPFL